MNIQDYKPGSKVYYRHRQLTYLGTVGVTFTRYNEETQKDETLTPVEDHRSGEVHYPSFGWQTGDEFRHLVATSKIKLGKQPKKEKVA